MPECRVHPAPLALAPALRALAAVICLGALQFAQAAGAALQGCAPTPQPVSEAETDAGLRSAPDRGLLWRIEKDGRSSWLYGTIHVARRGWMFPGPATQRALDRADRIALELDLLDPEIGRQLQAMVLARPDAPALPAPLASRLAAQAAAACVGQALTPLRPEMQALTLMTLAGRSQGLDPAYAIDIFLAGFARRQKKPVSSLESPAQQMALMVSDDAGEVARTVDETLRTLARPDTPQTLARLARDWDEGDGDDLAQYANWCACLNTPEARREYETVVTGRNPGLARGVSMLHDEGQAVFAAVGALHMVGPQGLPALLAGMGFTVARVPFLPRPAPTPTTAPTAPTVPGSLPP